MALDGHFKAEEGVVERILQPKQIKTKDHAAQIMSELKAEN